MSGLICENATLFSSSIFVTFLRFFVDNVNRFVNVENAFSNKYDVKNCNKICQLLFRKMLF